MAHLPYNDGINGAGLRTVEELLAYLRRWPLAFYDQPFMSSYVHFLKPEHEACVLAIFDNEGSSEATLRRVAARSSHIELPLPLFHQVVRLRLSMLCRLEHVPARGEDEETMPTEQAVKHMFVLATDAAAAGLPYILCLMCTAKENAGYAADPLCRGMAMQLRDSESCDGWSEQNVMFVCCGAAQLLRGRKPDASERIAAKLERAKVAVTAAFAGEAPAAGLKCEAPACSAREPFAGAFKLCGKCRAVRYCCVVCQVRFTAVALRPGMR